MTNKQRNTYNWFYGMPPLHGIVYRFSTFLLRIVGRVFWRFRITGMENLPKEEPFLLLPNHSSALDPFWAGVCIMRGIRPMASASLLRIPVLGAYLKMVGCFPKMKYTKDRDSMRTLQELYEKGYIVLLFPEGNRCWNGRTAPVGGGIGRLIKRLGCKVVYTRLNTAYLYQPRWAKYPRWVPIEIEYDGPHGYSEEMTAEEITADVQEKLTLRGRSHPDSKVWGFRMAHGLPQFLWACPSCFEMETLKPLPKNGNALGCNSCGASWELDIESVLTGESTMSVAEAFDKIEAHFGSPPAANRKRFEEDGVALSAPAGELHFVPRGKKGTELLFQGAFLLDREGLRIESDGKTIWSVPLVDMKAISVEVKSLLHFRIDDKLYQLRFPDQSPLKWDHFLRKWRLHVVGSEH
jgi:1-acyl-sn-glycerol-3-phosphate acyltransferase